MMKTRKPETIINALKEKKAELQKISNVQQGNTWKASLKDLLNSATGKQSSINARLEHLYFTKKISTGEKTYLGNGSRNIYDESLKENFKTLIDTAIQHIEVHGLFQEDVEGNFLKQFNAAQILSGSLTIITIIFFIGKYVGESSKEREIINLEHNYNKVNDSIKKLNLRIINQKKSPNPR